jgi:hypothetical protein
MRRELVHLCVLLAGGFWPASSIDAAERSSRERGEAAVRGRPVMNPATWSRPAYDEVWKQWGLKEKPADYGRAFRQRYGLHLAGYANNDLPMGLHEVDGLVKGITTDCLLCHASSIGGKTIIGLGNASLDLQAMFDELGAADGVKASLPFKASNLRGTIDPVSPVLFLMEFRDADLNVGQPIKLDRSGPLASRPPAWWQLKKKKTRNWTGSIDARSGRVDMAILLHPFNSSEHIKKQEKVFADMHAFVLNTESPRYPFPVDEQKAARGQALFTRNCARCHGTYGQEWSYPSKVVDLESLGTDPLLAESLTKKNLEHFNRSWLAQEKGPDGKPFQVSDSGGYQAPALDGVWATAPYLHNGSAPTVYHVLNSKARPKFFTRSYRTEKEEYDPAKLGWKVTILERGPGVNLSPFEQRKIHDTTRPGQGNSGHLYGDKLTEVERLAVIEYLKTL